MENALVDYWLVHKEIKRIGWNRKRKWKDKEEEIRQKMNYPYLYFKLILLRYNFGLNIINFLLLEYYYYLIILIKI